MKIEQFLAALSKAGTEKMAEAQLSAYLARFDIRAYAFTYYAGHIKSGRELRYEYASDSLRPWHLYYLQEGFADVDRTLEKSHTMTLPLVWDVNEQLLIAKNVREKRIRLESLQFGIDKGISIPIHGPNGDFVTMTLHQFKGERCLQNVASHQFEWLSAAFLYYHHIKKILDVNRPAKTLLGITKREKQCLRATATSLRVQDIAAMLNISERTVNFHLQNAIKKLGTKNKYQAAYQYLELSHQIDDEAK